MRRFLQCLVVVCFVSVLAVGCGGAKVDAKAKPDANKTSGDGSDSKNADDGSDSKNADGSDTK